MVQREVAERAMSVALGQRSTTRVSRPGKTSLLSLMVALATTSIRLVRRVSREAFFPPPDVESAVIQAVPMSWEERRERWGVDPEKIMRIAKVGFAHPRKMIGSNLKLFAPNLKEAEIPPTARAEDLSPDDWARLVRSVRGKPIM
jgi:16S rRNA A1518/A1519 N6-dimethyltransferase RsmA/KsgA/DIM1 with predicted DNA glycosylase/AP lyase activity